MKLGASSFVQDAVAMRSPNSCVRIPHSRRSKSRQQLKTPGLWVPEEAFLIFGPCLNTYSKCLARQESFWANRTPLNKHLRKIDLSSRLVLKLNTLHPDSIRTNQ